MSVKPIDLPMGSTSGFPLTFCVRPSAVLRVITGIIVRSINRQIIGIAIGKRPITEWFEGLPCFADVDATTAVAIKGAVLRIAASGFHARPDHIEAGVSGSMCNGARAGFFRSETSARLHRADAK